jgi:hypothetical protein
VPNWLVVLLVLITGPLAGYGAVSAANYYIAHTTVSVDLVSWAIPEPGGGALYDIECQANTGNDCPQHVPPGSTYSGTVSVSGYYEGKNVSLRAPSPFRLVSTDPGLPVRVPASGVDITVVLGLPTSAGEYSFTGNMSFA